MKNNTVNNRKTGSANENNEKLYNSNKHFSNREKNKKS